MHESPFSDAVNSGQNRISGLIVAKDNFSDFEGPSKVLDGSRLDTVFTRLPTANPLR